MNRTGRLFLAPFWIQAALVPALFIGLFLLMLAIGWTYATTYLVLSVLLGLVFVFKIRIGFGSRINFYLRSDRADATTTRSRNDIATMAALNAYPFLAPISRPLLIPVRSLLLTFIMLSGLWWGWICILLVLAQIMTNQLVQHVILLEMAAGQVRRDRTASALLSDLRSGQSAHGKYYVYLRPFAITGQLHSEDPNVMHTAIRGKYPVDTYSMQGKQIGLEFPFINMNVSLRDQWAESELNPEWEAIFERGFRRLGILVALGHPGESLGAGRILTAENEWRETLVHLSRRASGFLVVPSSNAGTLWEIRWLRDTLAFRDCYFFVPGLQPGQSDCAAWQENRERLLPILRLPHHLGTPAMFAVDGDGRPHVVAMFGSALLTRYNSLRIFISPSTIEDAVQILATIATRSREAEIRDLMGIAERFLGALAHGREGLLNLDNLSDNLRHLVHNADDSSLSILWQCKTIVRVPNTEEVYYHGLTGRAVVTVRQDAFVDDKRFVFYVTSDGDKSASRVLGFRFLPYEEGPFRDFWGVNFSGSPPLSDKPSA